MKVGEGQAFNSVTRRRSYTGYNYLQETNHLLSVHSSDPKAPKDGLALAVRTGTRGCRC